MKELRLTAPISWLDGIDLRTGRIIQPDHPQRGESLAGKVVYVPHSIGSTVGAYTFFALRKYGTAPLKIVLEEPDSITIGAELAGIPVELKGAKEVKLEAEDIPEDFKRYLEREASVSNAKGFVKVKSVHISGVSYATIRDTGREWLRSIREKVRFRVMATTNPLGMDLIEWRRMGVPESFAKGQLDIVESLLAMGAIPSFTCTPYITGNLPQYGEHIAWGESSAVSFINSVVGARTNREGGTKTIVAAATGYTPLCGRHLDENRMPDLEVEVDGLEELVDYYALAYLIGDRYPKSAPLFRGVGEVSLPELKALAAAGAASGSVELFHIPGVTPNPLKESGRVTMVKKRDLRSVVDELSSFEGGADLVVLGCPHLSLQEFKTITSLVRDRRAKTKFWLYTSRAILSMIERSGMKRVLEKFGARIWSDTCMVVSPLEGMGIKKVATNSTKAAKYLRTLRGLDVEVLSMKEIVERYSAPA
ncbi:MAG: DUF521 domain-containing protein [Candidatus Korarchaeota archaeon]|nr:DUF521 domain-containing protein [Candidatus Korarchaeota archaeon]